MAIGTYLHYFYIVAECQGDFEDALAFATACMLDDDNNRPLVGITNICPSVCCF